MEPRTARHPVPCPALRYAKRKNENTNNKNEEKKRGSAKEKGGPAGGGHGMELVIVGRGRFVCVVASRGEKNKQEGRRRFCHSLERAETA